MISTIDLQAQLEAIPAKLLKEAFLQEIQNHLEWHADLFARDVATRGSYLAIKQLRDKNEDGR